MNMKDFGTDFRNAPFSVTGSKMLWRNKQTNKQKSEDSGGG